MAKDNLEKLGESVKKFLKKIFFFIEFLVDRLIEKVHLLDPKENTKQRVVSAIILIPVALYAIFYSKDLFLLLAFAAAIIVASEWLDIIKDAPDQNKWRLIGLLYILIPFYSVVKIRFYDADILFWMFAVIWSTDIFAFFAGKSLGGPKLAPNISPNKTWSGLVGGIVASMLIGFLSSFMFRGGVFFFIFISAFLAIIEQISDLAESKVKRLFGVKDSGRIIPGHGGLLDRLDGMMFVAPTVLFLITVFADKFGG